MSFELHPQLAKDTTVIGHFPLCVALLSKDSAVPWVILVPKRENLKELHHLPMKEQQQFLLESQAVAQALEATFRPDKLNLGALGNMVPQLHIHHIARFKDDIAWPGPVWGNTKGEQRSDEEQADIMTRIGNVLSLSSLFTRG
ncbi:MULTISPECIES: HIT domain-containing protein [Vibrio]|jgi:diadenosine tetraphosphate (Ap4A) HIT family hydrolase|uniref:HIT domain-containing protein n=2 Tax=Vibrio TaxID=662 RepID=A0A2S9ZPJ8_9VIBR|nr:MULTISPECIES: HIT domain-containing protein [Vibrio]AYV22109.1 HIT domain-containing protein [Vibrio mediterranei]KFA99007.1 HIT family hydrolase [Vibrio sp. ER1A]MCF4171649.1 HIT domain-containing protein [Vibrio sp. McD22-P3]MCG9623414.1 HIT domain-containing protein [Vibrio mediterranei]MCG9660047.1 HIT domain-containing protein [Vibrio mediterranei]